MLFDVTSPFPHLSLFAQIDLVILSQAIVLTHELVNAHLDGMKI